jgi:alkaline phosphatase D
MKTLLLSVLFLAFSVLAHAQTITPLNAPFTQGQAMQFAYSGGTGSPLDWIGIYKTGQIPGNVPSTVWQYVPTASGQVQFGGTLTPGYYDIHLFCCDGYDKLASFNNFLVAGQVLASRLKFYKDTDSIQIKSFGANIGDEVRIYHAADFSNGNILPGAVPLAVKTVASVNANLESSLKFAPLPVVGEFVGTIFSGSQINGHDPFEVMPAPVMPPVVTRIGLGSCGYQNSPQPTLENILTHDIDFFLYLGDNLYIDTYDENVLRSEYENFITKRTEYQQVRSSVPVLATWDDHDYGCCDEDADYPLKAESQQIFLDFFEEPANSPRRTQEGIYTSYTIGDAGQKLQVIILDTRYFEDDKRPNNGCGINDYCPWDLPSDSFRTILGPAQWAWLKTVLEEPADLRLVASSVQFSSSYHGFESWRLFPHERKKFQELVKETGAEHLFFVTGDMHYSEVSRLDDDPGMYPIYDFTSSGISQSWPPESNQNRVPGKVYGQPNTGLVEIDWAGKTVSFSAVDVANSVRYQHTVPFEEMEFGTSGLDGQAQPPTFFKQVPSPGMGSATLVFDEKTTGHLELFDIMGRQVRFVEVEQSDTVDLPNLFPGVYIARFSGKLGISAAKILVE